MSKPPKSDSYAVELKTLPGIKVLFYKSQDPKLKGKWVIKAFGTFPDSANQSNTTDVATECQYAWVNRPSRKHAAEVICQIVKDLLAHEVQESLHIDGKKVYFPHEKPKAKKAKS